MSDKPDNVSSLFISAIKAGSLKDVTKLVLSHGLSCCEGVYGGYALLRDTIESGHFEVAKFLLQQGTNVAHEIDCVSTPLHFAARQNCVELVQLLLKKNAPVNARNIQNETALHIAAKEGYIEVVEVLLSNNADVTAQTRDGSTPLLLAVEYGVGEVVEMLLQHACANFELEKDLMPLVSAGKKSNCTVLNQVLLGNPSVCNLVNKSIVRIVILDEGPSQIVDDLIDYGFSLCPEYFSESLLLAAMNKKYLKLIRNIVSHGPDPKFLKYSPLLLHTAVKSGFKELVELFLNSGCNANAKNKEGETCLNHVLRQNEEDKCMEIMRLLFSSGANIDEAPEALHAAAKEHLVKVCELFIENGASVNALNRRGKTPLYVADTYVEFRGDEETLTKITELLLKSGADGSIKDEFGLTEFHLAAMRGMKSLVHVFLNFGVDVNVLGKDDSTSLHLAAWCEREDIVETLCLNGANVNARNKYGWTPLHMTRGFKSSKTVTTLLNFGADINARGSENETALHCVCVDGGERVEILLINGCDINAETSHGDTALDTVIKLAKLYGEEDVLVEQLHEIVSGCSEDRNDPHFEPGRYEVIVALIRHLVKLKVAGLYVSERNLNLLNTSTYVFSDFEKQCEEEVSRMKNEALHWQVTLYDIVTEGANPSYARNKPLMDILNCFNLDSFPLYRNIVTENLKRSKSRFELLESGTNSLDILVKRSGSFTCVKNKKKCSLCINKLEKCVLPVLISEQIVSCLSDSDLKNLVSSSEALENELSSSFSDICVAGVRHKNAVEPTPMVNLNSNDSSQACFHLLNDATGCQMKNFS